MPRSRRRQHSKSRSRTRSRSNDRDREPKRRKIESFDSPQKRRSVRLSMHREASDRVLAPLHELSRLRIDTRAPDMPPLYVAMATWIPRCNMHQYNKYDGSEPEAIEKTPTKIEQTASTEIETLAADHQVVVEVQNVDKIGEVATKDSVKIDNYETEGSVKIMQDQTEESVKIGEVATKDSVKIDTGVTEESVKIGEVATKDSVKIDTGVTEESVKIGEVATKDSVKIDNYETEGSVKIMQDQTEKSVKIGEVATKDSVKIDNYETEGSVKIVQDRTEESVKIGEVATKDSVKIDNDETEGSVKIIKDQTEESVEIVRGSMEESVKIDKGQTEASVKINKDQTEASVKIDKEQTEASVKIDKDQTKASVEIDKDQIEESVKFDKDLTEASVKIDKDQTEESVKMEIEESIKIVKTATEERVKIGRHSSKKVVGSNKTKASPIKRISPKKAKKRHEESPKKDCTSLNSDNTISKKDDITHEDSPRKDSTILNIDDTASIKDDTSSKKVDNTCKENVTTPKNDIRKYLDVKRKSTVPKIDKTAVNLNKSLSDDDKGDKSSSDNEDPMDVDDPLKSDEMETNESQELDTSSVSKSEENISLVGLKTNSLIITPKKTMSPRQSQKRLESEKKKAERENQKQLRLAEKQKLKQERDDAKLKEKEEKEKKRKEADEEKEKKRKEVEEKAEAKRKEKEQEKLKKQQELDEKNKEKNKLEEMKKKSEEQKKKTAAAFVNFFVAKKSTEVEVKAKIEPAATMTFKPFKIKSDMRMAPLVRKHMTDAHKQLITEHIAQQNLQKLYLDELRAGKTKLKSGKTWPYEDCSDDVTIIEDSAEKLGETILEEKPKAEKMKAKYLKFHENQRPAYHGTWRKTSKFVTPKTPLGLDKGVFNYEVDSDEEWEDEVEGESIVGSDDEDKENESEVDNEYEVDNEFFVPHGHLSEDEGVDDDEDEKMDGPENHQAKLTELKHVFDEERKSKTKKLKPRLIGCIWSQKDKLVKDAIDHYLEPLAMICNNYPIIIKKRSEFDVKIEKKIMGKGLNKELIPDFLRLIHGNQNGKKIIVTEFLEFVNQKDLNPLKDVTRIGINRQLKKLANWMKCPDDGPLFKKMCWYVDEDVRRDYNVNLALPNQWEYVSAAVVGKTMEQ